MNHWTRCFTLLCCIMTSAVFASEKRQYDVQVLVFSHLTEKTLQSQTWQSEVAPAFSAPATLPQAASELAHEKYVLQRNPHYQVLFDGSYTETWTGGQSQVTIPISSTRLGATLSGYMTITLSHYFDVHTDLFLTEPTSLLKQIDADGFFSRFDQPTFGFHLLQNRRMRSNELNYLQHPVIGVLIKIIPVE
ncbi:MAG: CsiV family protein [Gammaproteobacteria bacterium]|nr:CsiV family protein [Gammaproteobacteria bacterium]